MVDEIAKALTELGTWLLAAIAIVVSAFISHVTWRFRPETERSRRIIFAGLVPVCLLIGSALLFSQRSDIYQLRFWLRVENVAGFSTLAIAGLVSAWLHTRRFPPRSATNLGKVFE